MRDECQLGERHVGVRGTVAVARAFADERDGLRPVMVGHSQGGMQAIKVLYRLAGKPGTKLYVWNPYTWRHALIDVRHGFHGAFVSAMRARSRSRRGWISTYRYRTATRAPSCSDARSS